MKNELDDLILSNIFLQKLFQIERNYFIRTQRFQI